MIVLDASAAAEWLLNRPAASTIAARVADPDESIHAPHLLTIEVAQVIRRYVRAGRLAAEAGSRALDNLSALDVTLHPHDLLLPRVWQLRENVTAYDAAYLALAEALGAPLLTMDVKLAASPGHHARCEVVGAP